MRLVRGETWLLDGLSPELVGLYFMRNKDLSFVKIRRGFTECSTQQDLPVAPAGLTQLASIRGKQKSVLKSSENKAVQVPYIFNLSRSMPYRAWCSGRE